MPRTFSASEVAEHNSAASLWVVINSNVYDVTEFRSMHPGGEELLLEYGGQDASFEAQLGHGTSRKARSLMSRYLIGTLAEEPQQIPVKSIISLEDMAAAHDAASAPAAAAVGGGGKMVDLENLGSTEAPKNVALDDLGSVVPKKAIALDDLGSAAPKIKVVALDDLGTAAAPKGNTVALEELGKPGKSEKKSNKKATNLEDLGNVDLPSYGTRTGRNPHRKLTNEKNIEEEDPKAEEVQEVEKVEEVDDETKGLVKILLASWALANKQEDQPEAVKVSEGENEDQEESEEEIMEANEVEPEKKKSRWARLSPKINLRSSFEWRTGASNEKKAATPNDDDTVQEDKEETVQALLGSQVPKSYTEMFEFNATVMGFGRHRWLGEVNRSFNDIVTNAANRGRLQEETEVLALRICKTVEGEATLSMYKSAMLAALRSMLPKTWDPQHETAWNWLWDAIDKNLRNILYKPCSWQPALLRLMSRFSDKEKEAMRDEVYVRFFQVAPQGQDFFKQSNTRLHFIATRAMDMTSELFNDPWEMTEQISALGLRHVGYGIPTHLIEPFANCFVEVLRENAPGEETALEGFQWSIGLVAKILIRVIQEGSTIVMKAINANSALQLRKAVALAPRGERAQWLLCIQVGTQNISPLFWSIESGSLEAARAMIQDLLTIRADRDRYYYGVDALFQAHPDIVEILCAKAQQLLSTLLDGLVWRSKRTINSWRRVNFYVKHLVVRDGKFAGALNAICVSNDVKIISNQVVVLLSDTLWAGVVRRQFILSKVGFLFSLMVFMLSEAILPKIASADELNIRITVFAGRIINYGFSMLRLLIFHGKRIFKAYKTGAVTPGRCPLPLYLKDEDAKMGICLLFLLMAMCAGEPMFYCLHQIPITGPTERCKEAESVMQLYIILAMAAMVLHWLLVINLSVFATKLAAFVLVIREVFGEVGKFMVAIIFILVTFSSAIASLRHEVAEFRTLPKAANCLFATTVGIYEGDYREMLHQPALLAAVFMFITVSAILLINLLIAQLNCSYDYVYGDMVGFARLARGRLIVDSMVACPPTRFVKFVASLRFDQLLEFDEGDVGLGGGIQIKEPANQNPTSDDIIQRFGGTSSPDMQWPEEENESDRYARIKALIMQLRKGPEEKFSKHSSAGTGNGTSASGHTTSQQEGDESSSSH